MMLGKYIRLLADVTIPDGSPQTPTTLASDGLKLHNFASNINFRSIQILAFKSDTYKSTVKVSAHHTNGG